MVCASLGRMKFRLGRRMPRAELLWLVHYLACVQRGRTVKDGTSEPSTGYSVDPIWCKPQHSWWSQTTWCRESCFDNAKQEVFCWSKRQQGWEVTVTLAILNLLELNFHPRPCPWYRRFLCWKGTLIFQPTNLARQYIRTGRIVVFKMHINIVYAEVNKRGVITVVYGEDEILLSA